MTILQGVSNDLEDPQVVLAFHRFGRGKVLVFTPVNPWYWQMAFEIPLEDMTHETLWQQIMRWLVNDVPAAVDVGTVVDRFAPGAQVTVTATVLDDTFIEVNNARVIATITAPSGLTRQLPLDWTIDADGEYEASFVPEEEGFHQIGVQATRGGGELGMGSAYIDVAELSTEAFGESSRRLNPSRKFAVFTIVQFRTIRSLPESASTALLLPEKTLFVTRRGPDAK